MSRTLTAQDRSALIRLASDLPEGSAERKAILAGLKKSAGANIREILQNHALWLSGEGGERADLSGFDL